MPNFRGGKNYKKSKHGEPEKVIFIDKEADQMVARIVRILGNLNTQVYCEDNRVRIAKIRSGIKKRVRFEIGDIVLISLRDIEVSKADPKGTRGDRGDIIAKYSPEQFMQLKTDGLNPNLFAQMETLDGLVKGINLEGVVEGQLVDNIDRLIEFTNEATEEKEGEEKEIDIDAI
jgi:initiation factor 1A